MSTIKKLSELTLAETTPAQAKFLIDNDNDLQTLPLENIQELFDSNFSTISSTFGEINTRFENIDNTLTSYNDAITAATNKGISNQSTINYIQTSLGTIPNDQPVQTQINGLSDRITTNTNNISSAVSRIDAAEDELESLQTQIDVLGGDVEAVQLTTKTIEDVAELQTNFSTLSATVQSNYDNLLSTDNEIQTSLNTLILSTIPGINTTIQEMENNLTGNIENNASAIITNAAAIESNTTSITQNFNSIQQASSDILDLQQSVGLLTTNIDNQNNNINNLQDQIDGFNIYNLLGYPEEDGVYTLQLTVLNGEATYEWVAVSAPTPEEPENPGGEEEPPIEDEEGQGDTE